MNRSDARRTRAPRLHLNVGPMRPVAIAITQVEIRAGDPGPVVQRLDALKTDRETVWNLRGQVCLAVQGYDDDPRELVDIAEVRSFFMRLQEAWPHWAYFLSRIDNSIPLLLSCSCTSVAWGGGHFSIDEARLGDVLARGFVGMNRMFDVYGFDSQANSVMTQSIVQVVREAWAKRRPR